MCAQFSVYNSILNGLRNLFKELRCDLEATRSLLTLNEVFYDNLREKQEVI